MPTAYGSATGEQLPPRAVAIWAALGPVVDAGRPLRILDVGGGSGNFAVPLARLGHEVTVVDPSADALATLGRRAQTAAVSERVSGVQGDGDQLAEALAAAPSPDGYDLALCHSVLEVVDDPAVTLRQIAAALHAGGQVSVAAANRSGAVLTRALAGHPLEALELLDDRDPTPRRAHPVRRRFTPDELLPLLEAAGLHPGTWRGIAVVADLLDAASGADPDAVRSFELALAETSPYRDIAAGLHVLATKP